MAFKHNFTSVRREDDDLVVSGASDPEPPDDILAVRVILAQGDRIEAAAVADVGAVWSVHVPSGGFVAGPATAVGVETRREHSTTITWVQPVEIPAP
jgi:hypothetical protein